MRLRPFLWCLGLRRLLRQRRANIALITGLTLPILIGAAGLTVDVGYWFIQRATLQIGADAGAMKAARDLQQTPSTLTATLNADALSAANNATNNQFNLAASNITLTVRSDNRTVQVSARTPAQTFFTRMFHIPFFNVQTSAVAGVAYTPLSTQATCYAADNFTYLYSTGFTTIDTSHTSGIDAYQCGTLPPQPPSLYGGYCSNGGLVIGLSCALLNTIIPGDSFIGFLLPIAYQIEPAGTTTSPNGVLSVVVGNVLQTLDNLFASPVKSSATYYSATSCPSYITGNCIVCGTSTCTISAGGYVGGITIGPGVTFAFAASGSSHTFEIVNGNLTISTQATLSSSTDTSAVFYMTGSTPGAVVLQTQLLFNTGPISTGSMVMTSKAGYASTSLVGLQTSAPATAMSYAEGQESSSSLLSLVTGSLGNIIGTNFSAATGVCTQATSSCSSLASSTAANPSPPDFHYGSLPQGSLLSFLNSLTYTISSLLQSEGITSTDSTTSGLTLTNGTPVYWSQTETTSSTFGATQASVSLLNLVLELLENTLLALFGGSNTTITVTSSAYGQVSGQSSTTSPSCSGQTSLYNSGTISPNYTIVYTNILAGSGSLLAGVLNSITGALQISGGANSASPIQDVVQLCGTTSNSATSIQPLSPTQAISNTTASASSTLELLQ